MKREVKGKATADMISQNYKFAWKTLFRLVGISDEFLDHEFKPSDSRDAKAVLLLLNRGMEAESVGYRKQQGQGQGNPDTTARQTQHTFSLFEWKVTRRIAAMAKQRPKVGGC